MLQKKDPREEITFGIILKRLVLILIPISSCVKSNSTAVGEEWRMLSSSNWALGVKLEIESFKDGC